MSLRCLLRILPLSFALQGVAAVPQGPNDLACVRSDLPSGKSDALFLVFGDHEGRLARMKRGPGASVSVSLLARNLKCVRAESDFHVVNCMRPTPPGSVFRADAAFTVLRQRTLAAGPIEREEGDRGEAVTENYAIYFRDDRSALELKWTLGVRQCRAVTAEERALVLGLE